VRDLVREVPADRLMIETDAPYLLPRDLKPMPRNRRNEPALLSHVARDVASATGKPIEQIAAETTATARAFFGLP
jgi:TatD DNase family protein